VERNAKAERNERILDGLIKIAATEVLREEIDALPSDEELEKMYPSVESLEKRGFAIINKEFRSINRKKALRKLARAAAAFFVFMGAFVTVLMAYPTTRNLILNLLIDVHDDHVVLDFGLGVYHGEDISEMELYYVPESFSLINRQSLDNMMNYVFENAMGDIIMKQRFLGRSLTVSLDTEYAHFTEIQLDTGVAHISVAQDEYDFSTIVWAEGDDVLFITSTLDIEILKNMAKHYMQR